MRPNLVAAAVARPSITWGRGGGGLKGGGGGGSVAGWHPGDASPTPSLSSSSRPPSLTSAKRFTPLISIRKFGTLNFTRRLNTWYAYVMGVMMIVGMEYKVELEKK